MGLFGAPRGIILESFLRRPCRVGSSGRPGHRKVRFWVHLVVLWSGLGIFSGTSGIFFSTLFVGMRLCGCRVFKVVSYVMLHGIPVYFGTLQYNSLTRKKTDRAETSSQVQAGMGFSGLMMQPHLFSSNPSSHRISSHSGTAVPMDHFLTSSII